jgi:hypothetical protein
LKPWGQPRRTSFSQRDREFGAQADASSVKANSASDHEDSLAGLVKVFCPAAKRGDGDIVDNLIIEGIAFGDGAFEGNGATVPADEVLQVKFSEAIVSGVKIGLVGRLKLGGHVLKAPYINFSGQRQQVQSGSRI